MSNKVVLGLSGGVDSAVAALLLQQMAFDVEGLYLITCAGYEKGAEKAKELASQLNIPLTTKDIQKEFHQKVIQDFAQSYYAGETPSPCLDCNRLIKWEYMLRHADQIGAPFVATGPYARIIKTDLQKYELHKGLDPQKDQSYMLSRLSQYELSRTILPLGAQNKINVRAIAHEYGLRIPKNEESQDLCFLQGTNYRDFLKTHFNFQEDAGTVQLIDGTVIGAHLGLSNYTIGQRKGLPAYKHPLFVLEKRHSDNTLIVGAANELGETRFTVRKLNWISGSPPKNTHQIETKIRYQAKPVLCDLTLSSDNRAEVQSHTMLRDITPGQFAVFYQDELVLGSGIISS